MLKPEIAQLLTECSSPYSLVVTIAKRARDISAQALEDKVMLDEKSVTTAITEFGAHKYRIVEHEIKEDNY
ncbi:MAG: DNA-directed RNA polymerase subunit omega [Oscillospiraceae bacterium]